MHNHNKWTLQDGRNGMQQKKGKWLIDARPMHMNKWTEMEEMEWNSKRKQNKQRMITDRCKWTLRDGRNRMALRTEL